MGTLRRIQDESWDRIWQLIKQHERGDMSVGVSRLRTYAIVCECYVSGQDATSGNLFHRFGFVNNLPRTHTFTRSVDVSPGSQYQLYAERDIFVVEVKPPDVNKSIALWEPGGPCGGVVPVWGGPVRINTELSNRAGFPIEEDAPIQIPMNMEAPPAVNRGTTE